MRYADSAVVVTMDYFRLPIIAFIGVLLYNEQVEMSLFIGASLMLFGNLVNFYQPKFKQEKRKQKKQSISQRDANWQAMLIIPSSAYLVSLLTQLLLKVLNSKINKGT